jgi:eukaryotic-like serine/threonine-protein kinase
LERRPPLTHAVNHVVRRCLEKDPEARWQSMADVAHELRWATTADPVAPRVSILRVWRQPIVMFPALLLAVSTAAVALLVRGRAPVKQPALAPLKLTLVAPEGLALTPFYSSGGPHFALSPDGERIAFVASAVGRPPSLWIRDLDSRVPQEVAGSNEASSPFWSPDGQSLGFVAEGRWKTVSLRGTRPTTLALVLDPAGATSNGDVILAGRGTGSVLRIPVRGGAPTEATVLRPDSGGHRWPQFLPDGRHFIYNESRGVMIAALDSPESTRLLETASTAVYAPPGFLLFVPVRSNRLMAQAVDPASFKPTGDPREVLDEVRYAGGTGYPPVSVAAKGLLAYWDGTTVSTNAEWLDRRGNRLPTLPVPLEGTHLAVSPDGRQVAFIRQAPSAPLPSIWLMDVSGNSSRFSFTSGGAWRPIWSADGRHVLFTSYSGKDLLLLRRPVSGAEKEQVVATVPLPLAQEGFGNYYITDWSDDARTALITGAQPGTGRDVMAFSVETGRLSPVFQTAAFEIQPRFSPDSRWIAYASNESGRWEVFVEPFPPSGTKKQVSMDGGSQPVWRRDGRELFFLAPDAKLMAISVTPGATLPFAGGTPQALFQTRLRPSYAPWPVNYDVTPDGQRFLMNAVRSDTGPTISIVVNWKPGNAHTRN